MARLIGAAVAEWFQSNGRDFEWRTWTDIYRLAVVEVLLQRTKAETVARFAPSFFTTYPSWTVLAASEVSALRGSLAPIGLADRKAHALKDLADHMLATGNHLSEEAPGVGQYIARAVAVTGNGSRLAMVDSNWVRVLHRIFAGKWMADYRWDPRLQALAQAVVEGAPDPRDVNWGVLDIGATVCKPVAPACAACPAQPHCNFAQAVTRPDSGP